MTHDELLAELDELDHSCSVVGITVSALRAVVELHRPIFRGCDEPYCCGAEDVCRCGDEYPCDTIQAIEKELG
jgi:hypothetical protein